ncbi:hypothetical protein Veis_1525 [Verminephrobacter eiseniae EF01-2]|uniref:Uncharacterized protein n=1 Tax=Verminephrobacter eiseniae (strain EF01-2) TaxID=391735 RepID=A1WI28_VEREI|nr:hypothetical protein Veis_1525 [Verminephrobacter eiseniae EF01-2]
MAKRLIGFWPSVVVSTAAKTCQSCRCSVCGGVTFLTTGNEFRGQQYSVGAAHRYCHDERSGGVTGNDSIGRGQRRCSLVSRHRSSVGLRWPSKRIAALHRLPIRSVLASDAPCAALRWLRAAYDI